MAETGGVATVTATLSAVSGQAVTVDLGFTGTATAATTTPRSGVQIVIAAGSTERYGDADGGSGRVGRGGRDDRGGHDGVTNGTEDGVQQVTATITDDDPAPTVVLSLAGSPMAEAGGVATVTATLSAVSGQAVTVDLGFTGTATMTDDYTRSGAQIVIAAGSTERPVTLTAVQDALDEADETIVVDITAVTNGVEYGAQQVSATIADDDAGPFGEPVAPGSPMVEAGGRGHGDGDAVGGFGPGGDGEPGLHGHGHADEDYTRQRRPDRDRGGEHQRFDHADGGSMTRWTRRTRRSWWTSTG